MLGPEWVNVYRKGWASSRKCIWSCTLALDFSSLTTTWVVLRPSFTSPSRTWNGTDRDEYAQRRQTDGHKQNNWHGVDKKTWDSHAEVSWCRQTHGDGHTRSRYTKVDGLVFTSMKERRSRQGNRGWRGGITTICYLAVKAQSDITGIAAAKLDPSKDQQPGPRPHWVSSTWQVRSVTGGLTFPNQPFPISFR